MFKNTKGGLFRNFPSGKTEEVERISTEVQDDYENLNHLLLKYKSLSEALYAQLQAVLDERQAVNQEYNKLFARIKLPLQQYLGQCHAGRDAIAYRDGLQQLLNIDAEPASSPQRPIHWDDNSLDEGLEVAIQNTNDLIRSARAGNIPSWQKQVIENLRLVFSLGAYDERQVQQALELAGVYPLYYSDFTPDKRGDFVIRSNANAILLPGLFRKEDSRYILVSSNGTRPECE